jgi:hypothetical protein
MMIVIMIPTTVLLSALLRRTLVLSVHYSAIPQQFTYSESLLKSNGTFHWFVRYSLITIHYSPL